MNEAAGSPDRTLSGKTIFMVGPFPPPVHGAAAVTETMARLLSRVMRVRRCDNSPGGLIRNASYHLKRVRGLMKALGALAGSAASGDVLYVTAAGGLGLFYDFLCVVAARLKGCRVVIHHHSFAYLNCRSAMMALLARTGGRDALHIVLCDRMGAELRRSYAVVAARTLGNAAFFPPDDIGSPSPAGVLRIGHMSNLSDEKGLDSVIALHRMAKAANLPVQLVLAGPPGDALAQGAIAAAQAEFRADCDYRGPVYGGDKTRFFADIDVFLFPTRYVNEAQPIVLFEAMAHGVPSIATDRGCIAEQLGDAQDGDRAGLVVARNEDFLQAALPLIREWAENPVALAAAKVAARARAARLHAANAAELDALLAAISTLGAGRID